MLRSGDTLGILNKTLIVNNPQMNIQRNEDRELYDNAQNS